MNKWIGQKPKDNFLGNWTLESISLACSQDEFWQQKHDVTHPVDSFGQISERLYAEGFRGVWRSKDFDSYIF